MQIFVKVTIQHQFDISLTIMRASLNSADVDVESLSTQPPFAELLCLLLCSSVTQYVTQAFKNRLTWRAEASVHASYSQMELEYPAY